MEIVVRCDTATKEIVPMCDLQEHKFSRHKQAGAFKNHNVVYCGLLKHQPVPSGPP